MSEDMSFREVLEEAQRGLIIIETVLNNIWYADVPSH